MQGHPSRANYSGRSVCLSVRTSVCPCACGFDRTLSAESQRTFDQTNALASGRHAEHNRHSCVLSDAVESNPRRSYHGLPDAAVLHRKGELSSRHIPGTMPNVSRDDSANVNVNGNIAPIRLPAHSPRNAIMFMSPACVGLRMCGSVLYDSVFHLSSRNPAKSANGYGKRKPVGIQRKKRSKR